jgi:hypothetical protein
MNRNQKIGLGLVALLVIVAGMTLTTYQRSTTEGASIRAFGLPLPDPDGGGPWGGAVGNIGIQDSNELRQVVAQAAIWAGAEVESVDGDCDRLADSIPLLLDEIIVTVQELGLGGALTRNDAHKLLVGADLTFVDETYFLAYLNC